MPEPYAIDAVLFDMDGTLVDSYESVERCWITLAEAMGMPGYVFPHGMTSEESIRQAIPEEPDDVVRRWDDLHMQIEIEDATTLTALPGAHDLLALLDERGIPWGIATSCAGPLAEARLVASGLPRPEVFVVAGDYSRGKPSPDPFLLAAASLGFAPERCLVVEDAPAGVAAGRAAGATVVAVTSTHAPDVLGDAHAVVASLSDIPALLAQPLADSTIGGHR